MEKKSDTGQNLVICITGTPGVGKTSVSKKVAALLNGRVIDVRSLVIKEKLFFSYDEYRETYIVNEDVLRDHLKKMLMKDRRQGTTSIIDTHLLGALRDLDIDFIVVLTCDPLILFNRIMSKNVSLRKAVENVVSEFLNQILVEAYKTFSIDRILVMDTSCKSIDAVAKEIVDIINSKNLQINKGALKQVDWSFRAPWISKLLSSTYSKS